MLLRSFLITIAVAIPFLGWHVARITADEPAAKQTDADKVELKTVNYQEFDDAIKKLKGNVVAIDVWYLGCAPCVKKFPNLVKLHETYGKEGLVCVSMNNVAEKEDFDKTLNFLKEKKAAFPNFLVKDTVANEKKWGDKYPSYAPPIMILFNRNGEQAKVFDENPKPEEVEAAIKKLLAEKVSK